MFDLIHYTKTEQEKLLKSITVLVDTREKEGKNEHILSYFDSNKIPWEKTKLNRGDYSFYIPANPDLCIPRNLYFDKRVIIERKANLVEISNNLTKERNRLKEEFTLAPETKVMLIENGSFSDIITHNYNSQYEPKSFIASIYSLWHEFNIPVIFMPDKKYTGQFIYGYFYYYLRNLIK